MVDDLAMQARDDGFQLNEKKCKELWITFAMNEPEFEYGLTVRPYRDCEQCKIVRS